MIARFAPGDLGPPLRGFRVRGFGVAAIYKASGDRSADASIRAPGSRAQAVAGPDEIDARRLRGPLPTAPRPGGLRALRTLNVPAMRPRLLLAGSCWPSAGCGGGTQLLRDPRAPSRSGVPRAARPRRRRSSAFPRWRRRTPRASPAADPVADAAGVALAVYPSAAPGTHPPAVVARADRRLAGRARRLGADGPADPRPAAALRARARCPRRPPTRSTALAPTGSGAGRRRPGDPGRRRGPTPAGLRARRRSRARDPYALAAAIDRFVTAAAGRSQRQRRDRLRRRPRLRDAGRRLGGRERRADAVRQRLRRSRRPPARRCSPTAARTSTCSGRRA